GFFARATGTVIIATDFFVFADKRLLLGRCGCWRFFILLGVFQRGGFVVTEVHLLSGLSLQLTALHFFDIVVAAHFNTAEVANGVLFHVVDHSLKQLEGFALVFLLGVFLGVGAQADALAQVIHVGEVFFPQQI